MYIPAHVAVRARYQAPGVPRLMPLCRKFIHEQLHLSVGHIPVAVVAIGEAGLAASAAVWSITEFSRPSGAWSHCVRCHAARCGHVGCVVTIRAPHPYRTLKQPCRWRR